MVGSRVALGMSKRLAGDSLFNSYLDAVDGAAVPPAEHGEVDVVLASPQGMGEVFYLIDGLSIWVWGAEGALCRGIL